MEPEFHSLGEIFQYMEEKDIPQDDMRRHVIFERFLHNKAREWGVPQHGVFELTPRCNFDCKMCYVHLSDEQMAGGGVELPGEVWIHLMGQAIEAGMMKAQLTGGEAMLHPDFDRIYTYLIDRGIQVAVMTNGLLLTDERIRYFKQNPPGVIQVTLYGGDEDCYERVTGRRMYHVVTEQVKKAKEIGCALSLTVTPSRYLRAEDVMKAREFAVEQDLTLRINSDLYRPNEETGRDLDSFNLEMEEYIRIRRMKYEADHMVIREYSGPLPEEGSSQEECFGLKCGAGRAMFCVTWKGEMKACLDLPISEYPLRDGFLPAWRSVNRQANRWRIPAECGSCVYQPVCNPCPAIHAIGGKDGHADKRICVRTKRMLAEGLLRLPEQNAAKGEGE